MPTQTAAKPAKPSNGKTSKRSSTGLASLASATMAEATGSNKVQAIRNWLVTCTVYDHFYIKDIYSLFTYSLRLQHLITGMKILHSKHLVLNPSQDNTL
jgi:hypothetical protein